MAIVDVIIILIAFLGLVIGFKVGIFKELTDFVALFISMVLAGMFKGVVANLLYTVLPFYNFGKATEELYSVNIIFYQVIMYFLLLLFS